MDGKLHPVEIKLTATPGTGHVEPLNRFLVVAGDDAPENRRWWDGGRT